MAINKWRGETQKKASRTTPSELWTNRNLSLMPPRLWHIDRADLAQSCCERSCISHPPFFLMRYAESHLNLGPPESQMSFQSSYLLVSCTPINHSQSLRSCILSSHFLYKINRIIPNPEGTGRPCIRVMFSLRPQPPDTQVKTEVFSDS